MLATKTEGERVAPRRNSREFPIMPASKYPPLAAEIWRWINRKEAEEDTYYQGIDRHADKIGISHDKMRRLTNGTTKRPSRADCVLIARYFGKEIDEVLETAGWDTYRSIQESVERHMPERRDLLGLLRLSDTALWRLSQSEEKHYADQILAGSEKLATRAVLIADQIRSWAAKLSDEARRDLRYKAG